MDNFWLNDLSILFNKKTFLDIVPFINIKLTNKLNAIFRLSIYFFIIIMLIKKDLKYIVVPIFIGIITILIYNNYKKLNNIESINSGNNTNGETMYNITNINNSGVPGCKLPTKDNPHMNPTFEDYKSGNLMQACPSYNNNVIKDLENINFNKDLYRDQFDIYNKENSQRQFYTMPVNSIMNDQGAFAEWCYSRPPTCKEGNAIQCNANLSGIQGGEKSTNSS